MITTFSPPETVTIPGDAAIEAAAYLSAAIDVLAELSGRHPDDFFDSQARSYSELMNALEATVPDAAVTLTEQQRTSDKSEDFIAEEKETLVLTEHVDPRAKELEAELRTLVAGEHGGIAAVVRDLRWRVDRLEVVAGIDTGADDG